MKLTLKLILLVAVLIQLPLYVTAAYKIATEDGTEQYQESETRTGYVNIFKNGHGIIYSTPEEAEANSEGRIAYGVVTYKLVE